MRYRTWSAFASGTPSQPPPKPADALAHCTAQQDVARAFEAVDDTSRLAVAIAWPGFDDSGVAGWGADNGPGEDGQPLCVRVAPDFDGRFLDVSLRSALDSRADWLQLASWNDWNERTQVEPRWEASLAADLLAGLAPDGAAVEVSLARLLRLRAHLAVFHGDSPPAESALLDATADYLSAVAHDPQVVAYD